MLRNALKSGIVVLVGINVLVGKLIGNNKCTGLNKRTGGNNCLLNFNLCHRMIKFELNNI